MEMMIWTYRCGPRITTLPRTTLRIFSAFSNALHILRRVYARVPLSHAESTHRVYTPNLPASPPKPKIAAHDQRIALPQHAYADGIQDVIALGGWKNITRQRDVRIGEAGGIYGLTIPCRRMRLGCELEPVR